MRYGDAVSWSIGGEIPSDVYDLKLYSPKPENFRGVDIVFSALPTDVARDVDMSFVGYGFTVFSDSSPYRMDPYVPLMIPEVNPDHISLIESHSRRFRGRLVKTPNCTTTIFVLSLKPIIDFVEDIDIINIVSMQAISGAGYSGLPAMAIQDNIIPFIKNEEEKLSYEPRKILGRVSGDHIEFRDLNIESITTRVPVSEGHTLVVEIISRRELDLGSIIRKIENFRSVPQSLKLPTAPREPIKVFRKTDRPQPRLDRDLEGGMSIAVGRFKLAGFSGYNVLKYVALGHNTVRGAAGNTILTAELAISMGYIKR
jgi:aspartate-semialdehyde dehydrogenase